MNLISKSLLLAQSAVPRRELAVRVPQPQTDPFRYQNET
jgi:hypothetical protein